MNQGIYHCPLCNGYFDYSANCPNCQGGLVDYGPVSYLLGAYSPYRPIEAMKLSDGLMDVQTHQCPHEVYCSFCGYDQVVMITEIQR